MIKAHNIISTFSIFFSFFSLSVHFLVSNFSFSSVLRDIVFICHLYENLSPPVTFDFHLVEILCDFISFRSVVHRRRHSILISLLFNFIFFFNFFLHFVYFPLWMGERWPFIIVHPFPDIYWIWNVIKTQMTKTMWQHKSPTIND